MSTKVVTGKVRFSFLSVFEPEAVMGGAPKYAASLIIPKSDVKTIAAIKTAIEEAKELGKTKHFGGKIPANVKTPLRDGDLDKPDNPEYANSYFVNAKSKYKPGIVDAEKNEILTREEVYSGCYGRASINFYSYSESGNKGIACGLNNLQKLQDGPSLAGSSSAEEDFANPVEGYDDLM